MQVERSIRRAPEVNLTALIDIVFHLMVFVMLTASFVMVDSMELSLPSARDSTVSAAAATRWGITLDEAGGIWLAGQPVTARELDEALGRAFSHTPDLPVVIRTRSGVSVEQLVAVMNAVYLAGGRNLAVEKAS